MGTERTAAATTQEHRSGPGRATARVLLAVVPAAVLGVYVRYPSLALLSYVALVPWVLAYTDDREPRAPLWPYAVGAWATWILLYPGCYGYGWFTPPFLGLVCFWTWLPFAPALRAIHRRFRLPRALSVAVVWVAVEWFRSELTIGHFDLYRLGGSQARFTTLIQVADVTGVYGLTFLVAAVNGLLADVLFWLRDRRRIAGGGRRVALTAAGVVVGFVVAWTYGAVRLRGLELEAGPRLAVVQPNVRHTIRNLRGVHLTEMIMTDEMVPEGVADLVVWPENAIMDDIRRDGPYREDLVWLARRKDAWFLVGALGYPDDHPGRTTNSAFLLDPEGRITGRYDKQVLFPWSEYVPQDARLERLSPWLHRLHRGFARMAWGFLATGVPGAGMNLLHVPWREGALPFAVLICVENAYPPAPAEAGRMGARFLVNITSEGDVGGPVQEQLLRICILRAVENRVGYVRAGNTGISGFIDPAGRVRSILVGERGGTINDAGVLVDRVVLAPPGKTPYARSRDAFAKGCALVTALLWGASWAGGRRRGLHVGAALTLVLAAGCPVRPDVDGDPANAGAAVERGTRLVREGRYAEALEALGQACAEPDACREALAPAAEAFTALRQPESGAEFFGKVALRQPGLGAEALGYRGYMLERSLRPDRARELYRESLDLRPTARVWGLLGNLLLRAGDRADAVHAFARGVELEPSEDLRYMLGYARMLAGDRAAAKSTLESVLAEDPRHARAWTALARVYLAEGETVPARTSLRHALEADPSSLDARFLLARMALREGELPETHRLLGEIFEIEATLGRGPRSDP